MLSSENNIKLIVAVTGASGAIYAKLLLNRIAPLIKEKDLLSVVFSKNASDIWQHEIGNICLPECAIQYNPDDFYAPFASGSCDYNRMIICPASMGVLGRIASGSADDLVTRAADVMLKERRKLILVPREAPYNLIHLNNMQKLTRLGAIICPASPSFYAQPKDINDLVNSIVERVITLADIDIPRYQWGKEE
jgi:flavin prenyltransferase